MELDPGAFSYECEIVNGKVAGSPFGPMSTIDSVGHVPVSVAIDDRDTNKHDGEPSTACGMEQNRHLRAARQRLHRQRALASQRASRHLCGFAHPATLSYLQDLGVTSIELLPIHGQATNCSCRNADASTTLGIFDARLFRAEASYATKALPGDRCGRSTPGSHRHGTSLA